MPLLWVVRSLERLDFDSVLHLVEVLLPDGRLDVTVEEGGCRLGLCA